MVEIFNDELFENVEVFDLELRFDPFLPGGPPTGVDLDPNVATVYIQDNDSNVLYLAYSAVKTLRYILA